MNIPEETNGKFPDTPRNQIPNLSNQQVYSVEQSPPIPSPARNKFGIPILSKKTVVFSLLYIVLALIPFGIYILSTRATTELRSRAMTPIPQPTCLGQDNTISTEPKNFGPHSLISILVAKPSSTQIMPASKLNVLYGKNVIKTIQIPSFSTPYYVIDKAFSVNATDQLYTFEVEFPNGKAYGWIPPQNSVCGKNSFSFNISEYQEKASAFMTDPYIQCWADAITGQCQNDYDFDDFTLIFGTPKMCGGIAGITCPEGFNCGLTGTNPDASGICLSIQPKSNDTPTPTIDPGFAQCKTINIYKNNVIVPIETLESGDSIVIAVAHSFASKARISVNNGPYYESSTKNAKDEFIFPYVIDTNASRFKVTAQVFRNNTWY